MKNTLLVILLLGAFNMISAQVESEIGFKYIKAKYLVDTERYEDAIIAFTDIIKENASYEDALIHRAKAKYFMSAYQGAKKDALDFIDMKGATPEALAILGKASYKLNDMEAAARTLGITTLLISDPVADEYLGNSLQSLGDASGACKAWSKAAHNGSSNASIKVRQNCGGQSTYTPPTQKPRQQETQTTTKPTPPSNDGVIKIKLPTEGSTTGGGTPTGGTTPSQTTKVPSTTPSSGYDGPATPPVDNTRNTLSIDDDLSIDIYGQGLGKRKVMDQPNILILSDTDGVVTVDICVNARGKVESAEFNSSMSTLSKEHLISLAIRKAKEFWFDTSEYRQQCGKMEFQISKM